MMPLCLLLIRPSIVRPNVNKKGIYLANQLVFLCIILVGCTQEPTVLFSPQLDQAQTLTASHQYLQAEQAYKEAIIQMPDSPLAYSGLGTLYASLGYWERAITTYGKALDIDSLHIETRHNLAVVYADIGRFPQAFALLDKLTATQPKYAPAHLSRSLLLIKQGRYTDAEIALLTGIRIAPKQADFYRHLGQLYTRKGLYKKAEKNLQKAATIAPNIAETWRLLGLLYFDWGRYSQALEQLNKALPLAPTNVEVHINLSQVLSALNRAPEAKAALKRFEELSTFASHIAQRRRALDADPDNTAARMALASYYLSLDRSDEAIPHYYAVLATEPDHIEARVQLANLYLKQGRTADILELCTPILANNPRAKEFYKLYFITGYVYLANNQLAKAETAFANTLQLNPSYVEAWNNMGNLQSLKNNPLAARRAFARALKLQPDFAPAHYNLATLYESQGAIAKARYHYLETLDSDSTYSEAHFALGSLYEQQDSTTAALMHYRHFLNRTTASNSKTIDARKKLTRLQASN